MRTILAIVALSCFGCGGGLTPEQNAEYDTLGAKKLALEAEHRQLESKAGKAFKRLGSLEKRQRGITQRVPSCGFDLKGDRLVFPFRHKPGYSAHFVSGKSTKKPHSKCKTYRLKVRK